MITTVPTPKELSPKEAAIAARAALVPAVELLMFNAFIPGPAAAVILDQLREVLSKPVVIHAWYLGGTFKIEPSIGR